MSKIPFAVIGVGNMGKNHVRVLSELSNDVDLKYIVDTDEMLGGAFATRYKCKYAKNFQDIVHEVDAVSIVVPTEYHYDVAAYFLNAGKHVILEKPIARTLDEARRLIDIAQKTGKVFQIGHIERFNPAIQVVKKIIKDPYLVEIQRLNPASNRISNVGVILDLQIHDIDLALYLIESSVKNINAISKTFGPQEDLVITQMEFENGCLANLTTSRVTHNKIRKIGVSQKDCYIEGDLMSTQVEIMKQYAVRYGDTSNKFNYRSESTLDRVYVENKEPLKAEIQHFIESIKNNKMPLVTGGDGYKALKIAYKVLSAVTS